MDDCYDFDDDYDDHDDDQDDDYDDHDDYGDDQSHLVRQSTRWTQLETGTLMRKSLHFVHKLSNMRPSFGRHLTKSPNFYLVGYDTNTNTNISMKYLR